MANVLQERPILRFSEIKIHLSCYLFASSSIDFSRILDVVVVYFRYGGGFVQLSEAFRSDLRFFAFYLGNLRLVPEGVDDERMNYSTLFLSPSELLGQVFAAYLNVYVASKPEKAYYTASEYAAQFLASHIDPRYSVNLLTETEDMPVDTKEMPYVGSIIEFATDVGSKKLVPELLENINYHPVIIEYGSFLELVFALFCNHIQFGEAGSVGNIERGRYRAAQCIRNYVDPTFEVIPPFEDWEIELV